MPQTHEERMAAHLHETAAMAQRTREFIALSQQCYYNTRQNTAELQDLAARSVNLLRQTLHGRTRSDMRTTTPTGSILAVDPESTILSFLVDLLTDEGYDVLSASNAPSAVRLSISQAPALLLIDDWLPASEVIAQVHEDGVASLPIVVMTTEPHDRAALRVPSVSACLQKPFDLDELLACVARYVRPARAGGSLV